MLNRIKIIFSLFVITLPFAGIGQEITARVAGLENDSTYMSLLKKEQLLRHTEDSIVQTINTTRQLFTSDIPESEKEQYATKILQLEKELFEVSGDAPSSSMMLKPIIANNYCVLDNFICNEKGERIQRLPEVLSISPFVDSVAMFQNDKYVWRQIDLNGKLIGNAQYQCALGMMDNITYVGNIVSTLDDGNNRINVSALNKKGEELYRIELYYALRLRRRHHPSPAPAGIFLNDPSECLLMLRSILFSHERAYRLGRIAE